ncbi:RPE-spondin [Trichostrongylus colubriformis]|uniref:RPE-spondin n=1 Tax=Trichostrongylus colubriformis TaxID=6319 RepID=A0AAN8FM73_TRICO
MLLSVSFTVAVFAIVAVDAGCYQQRLCCSGRNITCKTLDDGLEHLPSMNPFWHQNHRHRQHESSSETGPFSTYQTPYYEASGDGYDLIYPDVYDEKHHQRIGKVVFPDIVELEGSGAGDLYNKYARDNTDQNRASKRRRRKKKTSPARKITHLIFGHPQGPDEPPEEILRYTTRPKHLLIRYSVLSQFLPLKVTTTPSSPEEDEGPQFMYLRAPPTDCYCDESCVALGDCCSDYTYVCPRRDCQVSEWAAWEQCVPDEGMCGSGVEQRVRQVIDPPVRGGKECPPLKEMRTCFKDCSKRRSLDEATPFALNVNQRPRCIEITAGARPT